MIDQIARFVIPAALELLPPAMTSPEARAMLLAIGLQESEFRMRRQGGGGPARGFWQFEKPGIRGVVTHASSRKHLATVLGELRYGAALGQTVTLHGIVEHNDLLACIFARLLLWTLPDALPTANQAGVGWAQYLDAWRPGKPVPETWGAHFANAWAFVDGIDTETHTLAGARETIARRDQRIAELEAQLPTLKEDHDV
jgi:hypothetical protein